MKLDIPERSLADLASQIEAHIQNRLGNRIQNLQVVIRDACLVIQGRSRTYYCKQLAQHAATEVSTLPVGANEIEVP
ncbi:MAG: BON domain-containing protein [Planctomycetes bacterium]|nr:BON domain-containing protein [Planctomycetota bacterium]